MKSRPHIGLTGELQFLVEQKHVIDFAADRRTVINVESFAKRVGRKTI